MDDRFALPDFQLNERSRTGWNTRCEILLNDAFAGRWDNEPLMEFREAEGGDRLGPPTRNRAGLTSGQMYLRQVTM